MVIAYGAEEKEECSKWMEKIAAFSDVSKEAAIADYASGKTAILAGIDQHQTNPYLSNQGERYAYVAVDAGEQEMWFVTVMHSESWPQDHPSIQNKLGPFSEEEAQVHGIRIKSIHTDARVFCCKAIYEVVTEKSFKAVKL